MRYFEWNIYCLSVLFTFRFRKFNFIWSHSLCRITIVVYTTRKESSKYQTSCLEKTAIARVWILLFFYSLVEHRLKLPLTSRVYSVTSPKITFVYVLATETLFVTVMMTSLLFVTGWGLVTGLIVLPNVLHTFSKSLFGCQFYDWWGSVIKFIVGHTFDIPKLHTYRVINDLKSVLKRWITDVLYG